MNTGTEIDGGTLVALGDPLELVPSEVLQLSPVAEQQRCLQAFREFIESDEDVFVLSGPAGSGKSSLIPFFDEMGHEAGLQVEVCAPTGQAAKRLRAKGNLARTIHSAIYGDPQLAVSPSDEKPPVPTFQRLRVRSKTLWIVDEASMIGDSPYSDEQRAEEEVLFRDGNLLSDLLIELQHADFHNKMLFIGDPKQLPPVGNSESPCLDVRTFVERGLKVREFQLTNLHRTQELSALRKVGAFCSDGGKLSNLPDSWLQYGEITKDSSFEIPLARHGEDFGAGTAIAVVSTNALSDAFNLAIRRKIHAPTVTEAELLRGVVPGDRLILSRRSMRIPSSSGDEFLVESLEPGKDRTVRGVRNLAGVNVNLQFANLSFEECGQHFFLSTFLVTQSLDSTTSPAEISQILWVDLLRRLREGGVNDPLAVGLDAIQTDHLFNAFRVKFSYARTCHKAQGGEWPIVVVNATDSTSNGPRWGYTAASRAMEHLSIVSSLRGPRMMEVESDTENLEELFPAGYRSRLEKNGFEVLDLTPIEHGIQFSLQVLSSKLGRVSANLFFKKGKPSVAVSTGRWSTQQREVFQPALDLLKTSSTPSSSDIDVPESVARVLDRMRITAEKSHESGFNFEVLEPWTVRITLTRGEKIGSTHYHFGSKNKGLTSEKIDGKHQPNGDSVLIDLIRELKDTRGL
jgi:hypothetical protein